MWHKVGFGFLCEPGNPHRKGIFFLVSGVIHQVNMEQHLRPRVLLIQRQRSKEEPEELGARRAQCSSRKEYTWWARCWSWLVSGVQIIRAVEGDETRECVSHSDVFPWCLRLCLCVSKVFAFTSPSLPSLQPPRPLLCCFFRAYANSLLPLPQGFCTYSFLLFFFESSHPWSCSLILFKSLPKGTSIESFAWLFCVKSPYSCMMHFYFCHCAEHYIRYYLFVYCLYPLLKCEPP